MRALRMYVRCAVGSPSGGGTAVLAVTASTTGRLRLGYGYKRGGGGGGPLGQREVLGPRTVKRAAFAEVEGRDGVVKVHGSALHPAARRGTTTEGASSSTDIPRTFHGQ